MGKYYVSTGNLQVVISASHIKTKEDAVREVFLEHYGSDTKASSRVKVSEQGFDNHNDDIYFDTEEMLRSAGFQF